MENVNYYNVNLGGGLIERLPFLIHPNVGHTISFNGSLFEITVVCHKSEIRPLTEEEAIEQEKTNAQFQIKYVSEKIDLEIYTKKIRKL